MTGVARPETVIFDLGNVLLDWNADKILAALDVAPSERDLLRRELFAHPDWMALDHGKLTEAEAVERICRRSALQPETLNNALAAARVSLTPIPESLRLLQEFFDHGCRLLCLSNMSRENWAYVSRFEFIALFEGIVISAVEGRIKPDQDIFQLIVERYALQPSRTLFIDDSEANIETAGRLGIESFHFRRSAACYTGLRSRIFGD